MPVLQELVPRLDLSTLKGPQITKTALMKLDVHMLSITSMWTTVAHVFESARYLSVP